MTTPDNGVSTFGYVSGYPASRTVTSPGGRVSKTVVDGFGRVIKSAVKESSSPEVWIVTETRYSACSCSTTGKAKKTSRPYRANSSLTPTETVYWNTSTFDALGRPLQVTLPDGNATSYAYGIDATILATTTLVTEPGGKQKKYFNNGFGQLIRVHEPVVSSTLIESARYTYDVLGKTTLVQMGGTPQGTNPTSFSQTRTFEYNTQGQLYRATNPENGVVTYTYRTDGLLASKTDAKGQVLNYVYDDTTHKLVAVRNSSAQDLTTFRYGTTSDPSGWKAVGRLVSATNQEASGANAYTWWYAYDSMGRVSKQTLVTPQVVYNNGSLIKVASLQAQYTFDADGRMTQIKYPGTTQPWTIWTSWGGGLSQPTDNMNTDGALYAYTYNLLAQQTAIQAYNGSWVTQAWGAAYNAAGQLTNWNQGDESGYTINTRGYSATRGWLNSTYSQAANFSISYNYNPNGRVSSSSEQFNGGPVNNYTHSYDNLNRLTQTTAPTWTMSWIFDEFGNRTSQTGTGTASSMSQTMTYSSATNRILTPSYYNNYDANGNLLVAAADAGVAYDIFDRVKQVTKAGNTSQYAYDGFGKRVAKTDPSGNVTVMFYDISGRLLSMSDGTYSYNQQVYFAGQRLGQFNDRLGSVRHSPGTYSHYYPYGEEITSTGNDRYKFAETFRDSDTGLDYAINRCFASGLGRFLNTDPSARSVHRDSPQTWSRYTYAANDPVNYIDPTGNEECFISTTICLKPGPPDPCELLTAGFAFVMVDGSGPGCVSNALVLQPIKEEKPKVPDCQIQVFYRPTNYVPGDFNHITIRTIAFGVVTTFEGQPDHTPPIPDIGLAPCFIIVYGAGGSCATDAMLTGVTTTSLTGTGGLGTIQGGVGANSGETSRGINVCNAIGALLAANLRYNTHQLHYVINGAPNSSSYIYTLLLHSGLLGSDSPFGQPWGNTPGWGYDVIANPRGYQ